MKVSKLETRNNIMYELKTLQYEKWLKYRWFQLKLYLMFKDLSRHY